MNKSLTRNIYFGGLVLEAIGALFTVLGLHGIGVLLAVGIPVVVVASALLIVAWMSALIKTYQLGHWVWFVCLIGFTGVALLLYVFVGPQTPVAQQRH